jgi:penicillin amidase
LRLGASYGLVRLALRLAGGGIRHRPWQQSAVERLAALPRSGLPLSAPVDIHWNAHLVPFIEAKTDRDLAIALGVVHAHLRLAQMELLRRIAQGRLSEVLGPIAVPLDHGLRLLNPTRAVPLIELTLPPATREWIEGFVAGINHHLAVSPPPLEFRLLGIVAQPWTVTDVLDIARLAAADVNWLLWMRLLRAPRGRDWSEIWARLLADGAPVPSLGTGRPNHADIFAQVLLGLGRAGSNAVAVGGGYSRSGNAWLAGDPHLSLALPSVWLAASYRSPSYQVVGLMIPGIPATAIGRNPWIAWGGTNLHAASSELFDVSTVPDVEIRQQTVRLKVRWSSERDLILRESPFGPIISDAPLFGGGDRRDLALHWVGHRPSHELSALLAINRARDWEAFRAATIGFAVPGQNLLYADGNGRVGRQIAAWLPRRHRDPPADLVSPPTAAAAWRDSVTAAELPAEIDPPAGYLVSANDRPPEAETVIGWFFAPNDRAERLAHLLEAAGPPGFEELSRLSRDVGAPSMLELRDRLTAVLLPQWGSDVVARALSSWDGDYADDSAGALAFELVLAHLAEAILSAERLALYRAVWHGRQLMARDLDAVEPTVLAAATSAAITAARSAFIEFRCWGEAHRLRLSHPLGGAPIVGRRYRFADLAWPGSSDTVMKSAHGPVAGRHAVTYGSNARYMFDMSNPDGNYLVVLGGQDGALGGAAFLDQIELFRRGEYMQIPLDPETAHANFPHRTVLEP